jgi:hypothetical protein
MRIYAKSWLFILFLLYACGDGIQKKTSSDSGGIQKIVISPGQVFDLSGYAGGGGGNPFNLFDENAFVDPRNEKTVDAFIPVTNCQPTIHPAIYFGPKGNRIVADLKISYSLKEIWIYDGSRSADSCWIYTGNMKNWKEVSSFITGSQNGNPVWKKINLDEQSRYVMIRFSSYETAITEMVLYGTALQPVPAADSFTIHKGFTQTPLAGFLGVNYIMENEPQWMKPFHYSRIYNFALDYDNDTSRNENLVRFNMLHYGFYNKERGKYIFDIDTIQQVNQGDIWFSIRGVSKWMSDLGFTDKDRPVNRPSLNPEDPASYSRHASMMWHLAAFFGYNKVDTDLLSLSHKPLQSGRGSMHIFENGNEEDASWVGNKYCSPLEYFAQSTADWDGDEGRLGKKHGIRDADPRSQLMMSGLTGFDTSRIKVYRFLCENLRTDQQFIWQGGIQYHYYAQRGGKGISPEDDSLRWKMSKVADCSFRIAPGVKCFLGENGYDKSPVSRQSTPRIPGLSASQSQGIMQIRSINAAFFSGFDAYILYWLRDGYPEDDPRVYLTSGILRTLPDGKTKVYPGWYYISMMVNRLGKYRPDKIIREYGNVWVYRYRHTEKPDSVACFIYQPSVKGNRPVVYTLETGTTVGNRVARISFREDSDLGNEEIFPVTNEKLGLLIEGKPILVLYKELPAGK